MSAPVGSLISAPSGMRYTFAWIVRIAPARAYRLRVLAAHPGGTFPRGREIRPGDEAHPERPHTTATGVCMHHIFVRD